MGIYEPHGDAKTFFHVSSKSQIKITHMQPNTHNLDCPQMAPITSFSNVFSGPSMSHTGPWVILLGAHFFEFVGMGPKSPGEKNNQSISGCQAQQTVII